MPKHVTISEATKSKDWECTGGINAGDDSYRIYESKSTDEKLLVDGKDECSVLNTLHSVTDKQSSDIRND